MGEWWASTAATAVLLLLGTTETEAEFVGPDIFALKFSLHFSKTERPKTETKIFG
uniref:Uncharacterized protein n=1 Tax=Oryza sativa subsp. japonica TaxID=39947 RepID=Q7Y176_ORYSJ|nr:hypothetical protein [Oryza sativa Japonica Group]